MKESILKRARELFLTRGFKLVTMDDIAREMGISKKTIYSVYKSKADLIQDVIDDMFDEVITKLENLVDTFDTAIHEFFYSQNCVKEMLGESVTPSSFYEFHKYYQEIAEKTERKRKKYINEHLMRNLKKGIEQGCYRKEIEIDIEFMKKMYYVINSSIIHSEEFRELHKSQDVDTLHFKYIEYYLRGIVTPKGLEILEQLIK